MSYWGRDQIQDSLIGRGQSMRLLKSVGLLLAVAALLKAWQGGGTLSVPMAGVIVVELALAAACLVNFRPRATRIAAIALFGVFALYEAALVAGGAESCGCFGAVKVAPHWTLALDVGVLFLLGRDGWARARRTDSSADFGWRLIRLKQQSSDVMGASGRRYAMAFAALALPTAIVAAVRQPATLEGDAALDAAGGLVVLEPENWVGKTLPIRSAIDVGGDIGRGEWVLLVYHHDCPKCQETTPRYREMARELSAAGASTRIALIETPPYGVPSAISSQACLAGRLSDEREWFVQTPVEIRLSDGRVTGVRHDL